MGLVINGEKIDEDVIYREFENIKSSYEEQSGEYTCCEHDDEFMGYARENIISRVLLTQQAIKKVDPIGPAEVDEALADLIEQHGGEEQFFANFNLTEEQKPQIREDVAKNLLVQRLIEQVVGDGGQPDDEELKAFYDSNIDRYMMPEKVRVSHILKSLTHGEDRSEAYGKLLEARKELLAGADFVEVCDKVSDRPDDGGDLGFFGRGDLAEEFEAVAFSLNQDEISPVFVTPFGYHLAKLVDREAATPIPMGDVETLAEDFIQDRRDSRVRDYVKRLEDDSEIEEFEESDETEEVSAD